jgi:hypothetical protein
MDIEELKSCRICGNQNLIQIIDLGEHSLSGRFPARDEPDPPIAPLVLVKCDETESNHCGLVQLKHKVPGDELYCHNYGYCSGINQTMRNHLEEIVREIESRTSLKEGDTVLDTGSNDATLLKFYSPKLRKIGIDPTGAQFQRFYTQDITLVSDFFTADNFRKVSRDDAKVITSIAMFYDLPDPCAFARDVKSCLTKDGIWVFEQSYMPFMLDTTSFDTICHEHLEYYGLKQINEILKRAGMKAIDVNFNDTNGGSFRISAVHKENPTTPTIHLTEAISLEHARGLDSMQPYQDFVARADRAKREITAFITEERARGRKFYICGASTKGNTLLQYFGLDRNSIVAAAERNPEKYGRRTPRTNIPIISEEEARAARPDYFIVLPWHFREEIIKREKSYLSGGGKLLFPLPKFEVVGFKDV